jgi:hypothetical protein
VVLPLLSILYGESCLLVSWCAGGKCDMVGRDENRGRSRRPRVEDWRLSSTGRVMLCAVCTMHKETRSAGFLVEPQNQGLWFVSDLTSKPLGQVFHFGPQNQQLRFGDLGLKMTARVFWFGCQNHAGYGLLVVPQNRWDDDDDVGHASRSSDLLRMEASRIRIFQSGLKTGGGAAQMLHMASSRSLR